MAWAYFQNQASWDAYHNAVCTAEGIPRPGKRRSDNAVQINNQWTNASVDPIQVKGTGNVTAWVAHVPDSHIATYNISLSVPDSAVKFNADGMVTFTFNNRTYTGQPIVGFNWRKAKPSTWTDPDTGIVYQVP